MLALIETSMARGFLGSAAVRGRRDAASAQAASVRGVSGKQRAVLTALRDAQHAHEGQPVSAGQIAAACSGPWHGRSDLITQTLWLLPDPGERGRGRRLEDH